MRRLWRKPHLALAVLAMSLAIQSWFVLLNAWLGRGIGIDVPLAVWFFVVPFTKAVTLVPISFGGFGLREKTLAYFLLMVAAVPEAQGAAASILWQTEFVALGLSCGALWLLLGLRERTRAGAGPGSLLRA